TPHDLPLAPNHQLLLASRAKDKDLEEGTPDHPGEPLETAEVNAETGVGKTSVARAPLRQPQGKLSPEAGGDGSVVQAALRESAPVSGASRLPTSDNPDATSGPVKLPSTGTVVLDVEQGGIV